ncbi:hypothetical protein C8R48DRAFT_669660 [Suillus tomentosus]|nr:hypothetical protein C8R48DRAFT_669660 [Suillus tomentosus]
MPTSMLLPAPSFHLYLTLPWVIPWVLAPSFHLYPTLLWAPAPSFHLSPTLMPLPALTPLPNADATLALKPLPNADATLALTPLLNTDATLALPPLPNADATLALTPLPNTDATSALTPLGIATCSLPNAYFIPNTTGTLSTYSHILPTFPVHSTTNEPCFDPNVPPNLNMGLDSNSDSMIPPIETLPDTVFVRDFELPLVQDSRKSEGHNIFEEQYDDIISHSSPASIALTPSPISPKEDSIDVFLVHPSFNNNIESTYSSAVPSSAFLVAPPNSITSLPREDEYVPSLMPSRPFKGNPEYNLPSKPTLRDSSLAQDDKDIPMLTLPGTAPTPTEGTFPYQGPSRPDGRKYVSFEGLTRLEAEEYPSSEFVKYNYYHSVYIPNVVQAIESYCFCQDEIIANDWNYHMFRDGSYPGHPIIPGTVKLPTGGLRFGRTWHE